MQGDSFTKKKTPQQWCQTQGSWIKGEIKRSDKSKYDQLQVKRIKEMNRAKSQKKKESEKMFKIL